MKLVFAETVTTEVSVSDEFYAEFKDNPDDAYMQVTYVMPQGAIVGIAENLDWGIHPKWEED